MKFCQSCGAQIHDQAVICTNCGSPVAQEKPKGRPANDGLGTAAKVFLIIGTICTAWCIIPLAWCLPITISICGKINRGEKIGTGLKVCALLFVNTLAGIFLLCRKDQA